MRTILTLLALATLTACEFTGLHRSKSEDNRETRVTINESLGQSLYLDNDGWSWLIDRFGAVVDGPFDIGNNLPPGTPVPDVPNPPPPSIPTPIPTPAEAGAGWFIVLLLPALLSGCVMNFAQGGSASLIDHAELQPSLALSLGSRTQAGAAAAQGNSDAWQDSQMDGGGKLDAKISQGRIEANTAAIEELQDSE